MYRVYYVLDASLCTFYELTHLMSIINLSHKFYCCSYFRDEKNWAAFPWKHKGPGQKEQLDPLGLASEPAHGSGEPYWNAAGHSTLKKGSNSILLL